MSKKAAIIYFSSCLFFTLFIYFPSGLYFLNDDLIHISLSSKSEFFQRNSLRPVHDLLLQLDFKLWSKNAEGFHFTALLIHLLCSLNLYLFSYHLMQRYEKMEKHKAVIASLMTTALFMVYAFHSEAVLWILGRTASLCTLFFLLSLICYLKKEKSVFYLIASLLFFHIGLFTYEAIWIEPICIFAFFLLDIFLLNRSWKKEIFFPVLYFLFFAGNLFLRYKTIGELAGKYDLGNATKLDLTNLFLNYNRLVARSFLPPMQSTTLFICFYAIIVGFIVFMILKNRKLFAHISVPVIVCCLFVISFAPYIFLGIDTHTTESERYLYLPSIFPCIFFGYSIANSAVSFKRIITIVTLIISYNIIFSFLNSRDYRVASSISKEVYHSIASEAKANDTVYITHLPGQFSGVPVFRLGLKEGLDLLYATDTAKIVVRDTSMFEIHRVYFINLLQQDFKINIQKSPARISNNSVDLTIELDKKYFKTIPYDAHKIF